MMTSCGGSCSPRIGGCCSTRRERERERERERGHVRARETDREGERERGGEKERERDEGGQGHEHGQRQVSDCFSGVYAKQVIEIERKRRVFSLLHPSEEDLHLSRERGERKTTRSSLGGTMSFQACLMISTAPRTTNVILRMTS